MVGHGVYTLPFFPAPGGRRCESYCELIVKDAMLCVACRCRCFGHTSHRPVVVVGVFVVVCVYRFRRLLLRCCVRCERETKPSLFICSVSRAPPFQVYCCCCCCCCLCSVYCDECNNRHRHSQTREKLCSSPWSKLRWHTAPNAMYTTCCFVVSRASQVQEGREGDRKAGRQAGTTTMRREDAE